ncbi:MAG: prepilin-type N-terminal cleavage/methylation domain-containing protein [Candidatus Zixiibacteriota bacterium]
MFSKKLRNTAGVSLIEVMISLILTGLLATASFQFYSSMNGSTLTQQNVSDLQHICRTTVYELKKCLRMAGYKIGAHVPYQVSGDTLFVYQQGTQPVDTISYFLVPAAVPDLEGERGRQLYRLVRRVNGASPAVMSDQLVGIDYQIVDSANVNITVTAESVRRDHEYTENDGYKRYSLVERVKIRNVN